MEFALFAADGRADGNSMIRIIEVYVYMLRYVILKRSFFPLDWRKQNEKEVLERDRSRFGRTKKSGGKWSNFIVTLYCNPVGGNEQEEQKSIFDALKNRINGKQPSFTDELGSCSSFIVRRSTRAVSVAELWSRFLFVSPGSVKNYRHVPLPKNEEGVLS